MPGAVRRVAGGAVPSRPMPISDHYDALVIDLDGVVFRGEEMIRRAAAFLGRDRELPRVCFVTNNSTRTVDGWTTLFARHGVPVAAADVVTSATATAAMLGRTASDRRIGAIGERGLLAALRSARLHVVDDLASAEVVVVGWDRQVAWPALRDAARAIDRGARFVVTNPDVRVPTPEGHVPGTGAAVAFLRAATGASPEIVGKPMTGLFERARERLGDPERVLVAGDQVATDVVAAHAVGWDAALVRTGVDSWPQLVGAPTTPRWVVADLAALDEPAPAVVRRAREQDEAAVRALLADEGADTHTGAGAALAADAVPAAGAGAQETGAGHLDRTLVAEDEDGAVVGTVAWDVVGTTALLHGTAVERSGHGGASDAELVTRGLREVASTGARSVHVLTAWADPLLESLGFVVVRAGDRAAADVLAVARSRRVGATGTVVLVRQL